MHNQCVSEHEKYALGATKPGGFAAGGFKSASSGGVPSEAEVTGVEFLSLRPPWKCSVCNVNCTSQDTLLSHASGIKHKRRARAAAEVKNIGATTSNGAQKKIESEHKGASVATASRPSKPPSTPSSSFSSNSSSDNEEVGIESKSEPLISEDTLQRAAKKVSKTLKAKGKVGLKALSKIIKKLGAAINDSKLVGVMKLMEERGVGTFNSKKGKLLGNPKVIP